jgi:hypothetical protein
MIMKTFLYVLATLVVLFIVAQAFIWRSVGNVEQHKYIVLKEYPEFEVRQYAPAIFSSVTMPVSSYERSSSSGFRVLAGYIFGGNEKQQSIAMTSPVKMVMGDSVKMSFMVPSNMKMEELPKPSNGSVYFEQEEQKIMAAIRFGGWASDEKIAEHKRKLLQLIEKEGLQTKGSCMYLGYNPPYELINRRNEVVVELQSFPAENK